MGRTVVGVDLGGVGPLWTGQIVVVNCMISVMTRSSPPTFAVLTGFPTNTVRENAVRMTVCNKTCL